MTTKLTRQDAEFFALESGNNPMHIGSLAIVDNAEQALRYDGLVELVRARLGLIPRYRSRIREIPFGLGRPVWVPYGRFDLGYHIRRMALPEPGADEQLHDLVARLASRPLDHSQPLWEMYLIEGLADDRSAVFVKSHAALADGDREPEIGQVILDTSRDPRPVAQPQLDSESEPGEIALTLDAVGHLVTRPHVALGMAHRRVGEAMTGIAGALARAGGSAASAGPLTVATSPNRRFATACIDLADYRRVHTRCECSINDVILAVITGALRQWLFARGELLSETMMLRACVPMAVTRAIGDSAVEAGEVSPFLIDLPIGEANPMVRLSQIAHANEVNAVGTRPVRARTLVHLAGFAPADLHAVSVRVASTFAQHAFNLMITNAPGPQTPRYIGGARMLEMYPVSPLLSNQALSIAVTSYNGKVCYGLNADRAALADVNVVAELLYESMEEMLNACS